MFHSLSRIARSRDFIYVINFLPSSSRGSTDLEGDINLCDDGVILLLCSPCDLVGDAQFLRLSAGD